MNRFKIQTIYLGFLMFLFLSIGPFLPGAKWGGRWGTPIKLPALPGQILYFAVCVFGVGMTGYYSCLTFVRDRRSAQGMMALRHFELSLTGQSRFCIGPFSGGPGRNILEVCISQPVDVQLDIELGFALRFSDEGKVHRGAVLVDPDEDEHCWQTVIRRSDEWTAWLDVVVKDGCQTLDGLTLTLTCFYAQDASFSEARLIEDVGD